MADMTASPIGAVAPPPSSVHDKLNAASPGRWGMLVFGVVLVGGLIYVGTRILKDLSGTPIVSAWPYVLLGIALLIALGFEFVNGFHDTANAVATVIYTHSLEPHIAVVWSGMWNLVGFFLLGDDSDAIELFAIIRKPDLPIPLRHHGNGAGPALRHPHVRLHQHGEAEPVSVAYCRAQFVVVLAFAANEIGTCRVWLPQERHHGDRFGAQCSALRRTTTWRPGLHTDRPARR